MDKNQKHQQLGTVSTVPTYGTVQGCGAVPFCRGSGSGAVYFFPGSGSYLRYIIVRQFIKNNANGTLFFQ